MPEFKYIKSEVDRMRGQVKLRQDILQLQRAGLSIASAELLLRRMPPTICSLWEHLDELKKDLPNLRTVQGGRS